MRTRDDHLKWHELERSKLIDTPVFTLVRSLRQANDGRQGEYVTAESPDWVNVICTTTDDQGRHCFVMVRQFRHGSSRVGTEFPGGIVDPGEFPEVAAARELVEETGYRAGRLELLGSVSPNPALLNNRLHIYLAQEVTDDGQQELDANELLDIRLVPVDDLPLLLATDEFEHALMHVSYLLWLRWMGKVDGS